MAYQTAHTNLEISPHQCEPSRSIEEGRDHFMETNYVECISNSGLSIFVPIEVGDPDLWKSTPDIEHILNEKLVGIDGLDVSIRARSKLVRQHICRALGYCHLQNPLKQPRFKAAAGGPERQEKCRCANGESINQGKMARQKRELPLQQANCEERQGRLA